MKLKLNNHDEPALVSDMDYSLVADKTFYLGTNGYVYYSTWEDGKSVPRTLHSLVLGSAYGTHIDHINRNKLDNQRDNLRAVSPQLNQVNRKPNPMRGVGRFKGSKKNPWKAQICVNYKVIHLGLFPTQEAAIDARIAAEIKYFGEVCPR
jgi:hypothetical protein